MGSDEFPAMSEAEKISGHDGTASPKETEGGGEEVGPCTQHNREGPLGHMKVPRTGSKAPTLGQPSTSTDAPSSSSKELGHLEQANGQNLSSFQEVVSMSVSAADASMSLEISAKEQATKEVKALLLPSKSRLDKIMGMGSLMPVSMSDSEKQTQSSSGAPAEGDTLPDPSSKPAFPMTEEKMELSSATCEASMDMEQSTGPLDLLDHPSNPPCPSEEDREEGSIAASSKNGEVTDRGRGSNTIGGDDPSFRKGESSGVDQLKTDGGPKVVEARPEISKLKSPIVVGKTDTSSDPKDKKLPGAQISSSLPSSCKLPPPKPQTASLAIVQEAKKSKKKSHKKMAPFRREG